MTILEQQKKMASDLKSEGFEVQYEVEGNSGTYYNMVAKRDDQAIAFEFKTQSQIGVSSPAISRLRQLARQDGYRDFRLVVVPEEQHKTIKIANLDKTLLLWMRQHPEIKNNSLLEQHDVKFKRVDMVQVDWLSSTAGQPGTDVSGVAAVEFGFPADEDRDWDCPFHFDVHLDSNWQLDSVRTLHLYLGSIEEYLEDYLMQKP